MCHITDHSCFARACNGSPVRTAVQSTLHQKKLDTTCQRVLPLQALLQQDEAGFSEAAGQTEDGQKASQISARWQEVAQLLGRKHDRIDSVQALPLLPLQVSILLTA